MRGHQHDVTLHVKGDDCIEFREWNKFLRREFLQEFLSRVLIFADREKKAPQKFSATLYLLYQCDIHNY